MKLAREPAGQEYSGQTIKFALAQKFKRFGFLFDLYSSFRPEAEAEPENDASNNEANQQVNRVIILKEARNRTLCHCGMRVGDALRRGPKLNRLPYSRVVSVP